RSVPGTGSDRRRRHCIAHRRRPYPGGISQAARDAVRRRRLCRVDKRLLGSTPMFTGIVTDIGTVAAVKPLSEGVGLRIDTAYDPETIAIGASISCGGV